METPPSPPAASGLVQRLARIRADIQATAHKAQREPGAVTLVAVSKTQPQEAVLALLEAGHNVFGENRVQEAQAKFSALRGHKLFTLHLIGPLQSNKVKAALELFDVIETIDRPALVEALGKALKGASRRPRFLVQVNIGREPQKAGVLPEGLPDLLGLCQQHDIYIEGLMCIPPAGEDPVPYFTQLATLARQHGLKELSMGMSSDFEQAIACGATAVRVGSALFGARA